VTVLLLALAIGVAPIFAQFRPAPPRMVEVSLLDCSGLPCVALTTGSGKTLRLLIDLAEANAYLDAKAAREVGLDLQALKGSDGSDISQVQQTVVAGARLGDLPLGDFPFMVLDTTPQPDKPGEKPEPLPGDGALTYGAFKNRLVQIDAAQHVLRISEPRADAAACPHDCSKLVIKHAGHWGPVTLTTDGFTVNGQPVDVQLDTLFTGTTLIYPTSVEKLGLKKESKAKPKELFSYVQGGVKLARGDGGQMSFRGIPLLQDGPLYFGTKETNLPAVQYDATVGMGVLRRAVVTFDFKGMYFWMDSVPAQ
jgi:hypothetical protein